MTSYRWGFIGLDLIALHGALFTDWAATPGLVLGSAGAGLRFNFMKIAGALIRVDLAQTLTPSEGWDLSFGVGQLF